MNEMSTAPSQQSALNAPIKVIGVGGGGSNAVNTMYDRGIQGVDFIVCNTDAQALDASPVPIKVQLGATLTGGQGAGSLPDVGRNAAIETLDEIKDLIGKDTSMVFITAGMGGGTGTGAAPVIAKAAREMDILTVGIVTIPFQFEGRRRGDQASEGLERMRESVDTLLIIRNDKLRELYGNLTIRAAFNNADEILCTAAKGIAEVITLTGEINVDMNDVNTVMRDSGRAIMGSGTASGEGRARTAVTEALESPLLNDCDITGANFVLLNITFGTEEILMDEIMEITDFIQESAGQSAEVIWGYGVDQSLKEDLCVTVIATGFKGHEQWEGPKKPEQTKFILGDPKEIKAPVQPTQPYAEPVISKEEAEMPFLKSDAPIEASAPQEPTERRPELTETPQPSEAPTFFSLDESASDARETTEAPSEHGENEAAEAPSISGTNGDEPSVTVYTLESDPLPPTTEEPNLGNIKFTEDGPPKKETSPINRPLSRTPDLAGDASKDVFPSVTRPAENELQARNVRLSQFTRKLKTPGGLADLEAEPAYKRRQVILDDVDHSSKSQVSRFSLHEETDEEGERTIELRNDNPFLHDNVD